MNKKRIISAVLATALTVTAVNAPEIFPTSLTAYAEDDYKPGDKVKTDFVYLRLLEDNTWEVFYPTDAETNCQKNLTGTAIPTRYKGRAVTRIADNAFPGNKCFPLGSIEIPEGITSIGKGAFASPSVTPSSIKVPSTVTSIGAEAFSYTNITKMELPTGITRIEDGTFDCCNWLKSVNIPSGVTYIGKNAFHNCDELSSVEFPPNLKTIGAHAFDLCEGTTFSKIPNTVEEIGSKAFRCCYKLTEVVVPDSVKSLGTYVFEHCEKIETAVLPKHFTSIPAGTFYYCTSLTEFSISDKVESIGDEAFYWCTSLKSIFIPKGVTSIGSKAFYGSGVKDIYYEGSEDDWFDNVTRGNNYAAASVNVHFNCTKPAGVPVEVKINAPSTVNTSNLTVKVTGNGVNKTLTITNGMLDVSSLANGTYTFTFSANNCAPRAYTATVSNGTATGLSKVELNLYGDIDGNLKINSTDILKVKLHSKGSQKLSAYDAVVADVTKDNKINSTDVLKLKLHAKGSSKLW